MFSSANGMIEIDHDELRKRPLARPLFLWIAGILCEVCFPLQLWSVVLLAPAIVALVYSLGSGAKVPEIQIGGVRLSEIAIVCLTVFLAIQWTALAERRLDDPVRTGDTPEWRRAAQVVQRRVVERFGTLRLSDDEHAVLASITVNERSTMTRDLRRRFSAAGVAHLLAVSGFHVALVCGALALLLSGLPRTTPFRLLRSGLMILGAWSYATVSGLSAPSVRAATMLTIYLVGVALRRWPERYNTLAATALLMLLCDPFSLFDVGFLLSFSAVFFILLLAPRIAGLFEVERRWIAIPWNVVAVSLAAQIGTFPLCCYYFGRASLVFLFANLFLSFAATLLIPVALVWVALPAETPGLFVLQVAVEQLTHIIVGVVDRFSCLPWASVAVHFDLVWLIGCYALFFFAFHALLRRSSRSLLVVLGIVLTLIIHALMKKYFGF